MATPGPKPKVSDFRLLFEVMVVDDGAVFAGQLLETVPLESVQGIRDRLNELADESEWLELEKVGNRNLYRLTEAGRTRLLDEIRSRLD
jgi:hypothetical protein